MGLVNGRGRFSTPTAPRPLDRFSCYWYVSFAHKLAEFVQLSRLARRQWGWVAYALQHRRNVASRRHISCHSYNSYSAQKNLVSITGLLSIYAVFQLSCGGLLQLLISKYWRTDAWYQLCTQHMCTHVMTWRKLKGRIQEFYDRGAAEPARGLGDEYPQWDPEAAHRWSPETKILKVLQF